MRSPPFSNSILEKVIFLQPIKLGFLKKQTNLVIENLWKHVFLEELYHLSHLTKKVCNAFRFLRDAKPSHPFISYCQITLTPSYANSGFPCFLSISRGFTNSLYSKSLKTSKPYELYYLSHLPKKVCNAVRFLRDAKPSLPFISAWLMVLGLGLWSPVIV